MILHFGASREVSRLLGQSEFYTLKEIECMYVYVFCVSVLEQIKDQISLNYNYIHFKIIPILLSLRESSSHVCPPLLHYTELPTSSSVNTIVCFANHYQTSSLNQTTIKLSHYT